MKYLLSVFFLLALTAGCSSASDSIELDSNLGDGAAYGDGAISGDLGDSLSSDGDSGVGRDGGEEQWGDGSALDLEGIGDAVVPGGLGYPCKTAAECTEGFCIQTLEGSVCTISCIEECPKNWACALYVPSLPDTLYICTPAGLDLCRPCLSNADCRLNGVDTGAVCINYGPAGFFCGAACSDGKPCPEGYECTQVEDASGAGVKQCLKLDGECSCSPFAVSAGASTTCYNQNEWGLCKGDRSCKASGLTPCSAGNAALEVCNGADDDCDLAVDEDTDGEDCVVANSFGACPGKTACDKGKLSCIGPEPKAEICDGSDNNCDGNTDENFPDTDGDGIADCLEQDKDGDGIPDVLDNCPAKFNPLQEDFDSDNFGDACDADDDNDQSPDEEDCAPKDASVHPGAVEVCDGKDNDCNSIVDEGFTDTDADGWKDCVDTDDDNDQTIDAADCAPTDPSAYPGAPELCDGIDNDCDGDVDEKFPDTDGDNVADCVDSDLDGDGLPNASDNCPGVKNPGQEDLDKDGIGDLCDADADGDSIPDSMDNCKGVKNTLQTDTDKDGLGDECDSDMDGDGKENQADNCPMVPNPNQEDSDQDGVGDACEDDMDGDGTPDAQDCAPLNPAVHPKAEEVCDGVDNNCNGVIDEGFPDLDADGLKNCVDPDDDDDGDPDDSDCAPLNASIHHKAVEVCDGVDNNCDGLVDNGLPMISCGKGQCAHSAPSCKDGLPQTCNPLEGATPEVCDGIDNDCDGLVDDGLEMISCGLGLCKHWVKSCVDGKPVVCDPFEGASTEKCDGVDNDCDGQTDEELGTVTCGQGVCKHSVDKCVDGELQACDPFQGAQAEVCDGLDNDCDGKIDEDLGTVTCGLGVCKHTVPACENGKPVICDPYEGAGDEVCDDGLDNDCDGQVDVVCGPGGSLWCADGVCCNMPCTGPCVGCDIPGSKGLCTAHKIGTDPDLDCGPALCTGSEVANSASTCFAACTDQESALQCKPGFHCDDLSCQADLDASFPCNEDSDCASKACRLDWDGEGLFCAADKLSCVDDDGNDGVKLHPNEWVECDEGDAFRWCSAGEWMPPPSEPATTCPAGSCNGGCGYFTDEDNACVSGLGLGLKGGCEWEDLSSGVSCVDCGHLKAVKGACGAGSSACSKSCGAPCDGGDKADSGVDVCFPDENGDSWNRFDSCQAQGDVCSMADDGHESDTLAKDCGAFDCTNGQCITNCQGNDALCNTNFICVADNTCKDPALAAPWLAQNKFWLLTKNDGTYFQNPACNGNFFGQNDATIEGIPMKVGPHLAGGDKMAGLPPSLVVPTPFSATFVQHAHIIFPGGRCSSQPLSVTFYYTDNTSYTTAQASIPHDCSNGGTWSGTNYYIKSQGNYGGPCCDNWYYGRFTNPNQGKAVKSTSIYYTDGCGGSYLGQIWTLTLQKP